MIEAAVNEVRRRDGRVPELALILGSGLGHLAEVMEEFTVIPSSELPGYPRSTVAGHRGELVLGRLEGRVVVMVRGRLHRYEGWSVPEVIFPVGLVHALGARKLIVTNAAGGVNPRFTPGTLMFITDHLDLTFGGSAMGRRLQMLRPSYSEAWLDRAEAAALHLGISTRRGVYAWVLGPSYETPAEVRFIARTGADAVGMSTVPEVVAATERGLDVLGLSTITNPAAGLSNEALSHDEVLAVGAQVRDRLGQLVRAIVRSG